MAVGRRRRLLAAIGVVAVAWPWALTAVADTGPGRLLDANAQWEWRADARHPHLLMGVAVEIWQQQSGTQITTWARVTRERCRKSPHAESCSGRSGPRVSEATLTMNPAMTHASAHLRFADRETATITWNADPVHADITVDHGEELCFGTGASYESAMVGRQATASGWVHGRRYTPSMHSGDWSYLSQGPSTGSCEAH